MRLLAVFGGLTAAAVAAAVMAGVVSLPPAVAVDARPASTPSAVSPTPDPTTKPATPASSEPEPTPSQPTPTEPAASEPSEPSEGQPDAPAEPSEPEVDIRAVQQRLTELGYYASAVDGISGPATDSAVMAFQKVNGLAVDGVVGPRTLAALADPVEPMLGDGPATRVDVDLDLQVLHYVEDGRRVRTMPASSGSGETYQSSSGGTARANTPVGTFTVEREIRGVREAPLGTLINPKYFHHGFAIHGSPSVPPYPASHGCIRVTIADSDWLFDRLPIGTPVVVRGGTHVFVPSDTAA